MYHVMYSCKLRCNDLRLRSLTCSTGLGCVCIGILLLYLALWIFHMVRAKRAVMRCSYTDNRTANISIAIQMYKGYACCSFATSRVLAIQAAPHACVSSFDSPSLSCP